MSDFDRNAKLKSIEKAREAKAEKRSALPSVELVKTLDDARDPEVILECVRMLQGGLSFDELRRSLGLGPSVRDNRWRQLRHHIMATLPESEEDGLRETYLGQAEVEDKLQSMLEDIESKLKNMSSSNENYPGLQRTRFDIIKLMKESNFDKQKTYLDTMKAKNGFGSIGGINIIIRSSVPRPKQKKIERKAKAILVDYTTKVEQESEDE